MIHLSGFITIRSGLRKQIFVRIVQGFHRTKTSMSVTVILNKSTVLRSSSFLIYFIMKTIPLKKTFISNAAGKLFIFFIFVFA